MTWRDRLREAAYTGGTSGRRQRFDFEDVSREYEARGTAHEFVGVNEAYVQRTGFSSREYPLRCFFSGANHDIEATNFEALLLEEGVGRLEHPMYPAVDVVPFGRITRRDDLKTAANQSVVEVTFWTTLRTVYPSTEADPQNEIAILLEAFDLAAAQQFADKMQLASAISRAQAKATTLGVIQAISAALESISDVSTSITQTWRSIESDINHGIDVLIGQPLLLAEQLIELTTLPARSLAAIEERLAQYGDLADSIFGSGAGRPLESITSGTSLPVRRERIANDFHLSDLAASSALAGSILAASSTPIDASSRANPTAGVRRSIGTNASGTPVFSTKPQALAAAQTILAQFANLVEWRDEGFGALSSIDGVGAYQFDDGASYQALQDAVSKTVGFLVQASFQLIPERVIVLDKARTIVDLSAELYGNVDESLDFLIATNDLTGAEILELPAGKSIVYYPS